MRNDEKVAVDFVVGTLAQRSLHEHFGRPELAEFLRLAGDGLEIAAAQQYQLVTGAPLPECRFAVLVARRHLARAG